MRQMQKTMQPPAIPVMRGIVRPMLASSVFFMVVTGIAYPLVTTGAAQLLFRDQAQGSLIENSGRPVGSAVIGQYFARPEYFHGRPSVTSGADPSDPSKTVDQPYNAGASAASNQGVLSKKLLDAVTASGSGLDPDISVANARLQAPRVAKARGLSTDEVLSLLDQYTTGRQFGVLGDPRINVLQLNLALDAAGRRAAQ